MSKLTDKIAEWARSLPYWEQAALEKIICGSELAAKDYDELLRYLLEDAGLSERSGDRPALNISNNLTVGTNGPSKGQRLKRLYRVKNVNALAEEQELSFSPNLTVIYGNNGSGKSGYARIIGNTSFTRGDKQVLRDVTKPYDPEIRQSVCFELETDRETYSLDHELDRPCPDMKMFHVFDSRSARVHLTKQNTLSFVPAGLEKLTLLTEVTDKVRERLDREIEKRRQGNHFSSHFDEDSSVRTLIVDLGKETDLENLRLLGTFTETESVRLEQVRKDISSYTSENLEEEIQKAQLIANDLHRLANSLKKVLEAILPARINDINKQISKWHDRGEVVRSLSKEQAGKGYQAGTSLWLDFVESAHRLAVTESADEGQYPRTDDKCLLCHQPLPISAIEHIRRLWALIESDAQEGLARLENELATTQRNLKDLDLDFFNDQLVSFRHLKNMEAAALYDIQDFLDECRLFRHDILEAVSEHHPVNPRGLKLDFLNDIQKIIGDQEALITNLKQANTEVEIAKLEGEQTELDHRRKLAKLLPEIELFMENAKWLAIASSPRARRSTRHISTQYNKFFDELVTQKYIVLLERNLLLLKCPAKIVVNTRARKGETFKQIALEMDESVPRNHIETDKVLSEGEQKAVALADFLTEVAMDESCSGIVLDDPVTSLDFDWKHLIAPIIIEEASQRQVVVFTHDLHFLYCLKEAAEEQGDLDIAAHWIEKREGIPGWVFQNNTPLTEMDYRSSHIAQQRLAEAKKANPEDKQRLLREGFGALRSSYEAFVMFGLLGSVVMRFGERISIERLKDVYIDPEIRDEVIAKVGFLSRYIGAHLHSDIYLAQKPTPELLKQEIDGFDQLKNRHKQYVNEMKKQLAGS